MSALRLAAEAAFMDPQLLASPPDQAQVTIRKARLAVMVPKPAVVDVGLCAAQAPGKVPRVFRIGAAPATNEAGTHATEGPLDKWALSPTAVTADDKALAKAVPRSRHVNADRRRGPVLHVTHASPQRAGIQETGPRLDDLITELASVGPVLEAIRQAQCFEIIDPRAADEWTRLGREAEELGRQLEALYGNKGRLR